MSGYAPGSFALRGAITARGEEVNTDAHEDEVDGDEARTRTDTRTKAEGDHDRVGAGTVVLYDLNPRAGIDLATHVGQQVQVTAVLLDRGKGDADVKVKEETNVDREHGTDGKARANRRSRWIAATDRASTSSP